MTGVLIVLYRLLTAFAHRVLGPHLTHTLGELVMHSPLWILFRRFGGTHKTLRTTVCGAVLRTPLIAAAGIDKNCRFLGQLLDIGFGGVVGGTITAEPRPGNPKPRLILNRADSAIINAMGFPNKGLAKAVRRLKRLTNRRELIFVSIAGDTPQEFGRCYDAVKDLCSAVEINVSSPNTAALSAFRSAQGLRSVFAEMRPFTTPLLLKLPRPTDKQSSQTMTDLAAEALGGGVAGLVACNTRPVTDARLGVGKGGLSGNVLFNSTVDAVRGLKKEFPNTEIIACGGVSNAAQVRLLQEAGAVAVQLYSAFVYKGPALPSKINRDLRRERS